MLNSWEAGDKASRSSPAETVTGAHVPHIIIEYSANLADHADIGELLDAVHRAGLDHELASPEALRTRAAAREHYRIADGHPDNAFVAIQVRLGPGRDTASVASFLTTLLDTAQRLVEAGDQPLAVAWSIEAVEIDPDRRINDNRVRERMQERARRQEEGTA